MIMTTPPRLRLDHVTKTFGVKRTDIISVEHAGRSHGGLRTVFLVTWRTDD